MFLLQFLPVFDMRNCDLVCEVSWTEMCLYSIFLSSVGFYILLWLCLFRCCISGADLLRSVLRIYEHKVHDKLSLVYTFMLMPFEWTSFPLSMYVAVGWIWPRYFLLCNILIFFLKMSHRWCFIIFFPPMFQGIDIRAVKQFFLLCFSQKRSLPRLCASCL